MVAPDDGVEATLELTRWLCRDALMRPAPAWVVRSLREANRRRQRLPCVLSSSFTMMSELLLLGAGGVRRTQVTPLLRRRDAS